MESFIGTIIQVAFGWAPQGWLPCDGRLLPIQQYTALFSLLGTTYGGDGQTTFALPDLRGRMPVCQGNGPGLSPMELGQKGGSGSATVALSGSASVSLSEANLPSHSHAASFSGSATPVSVAMHVSAGPGTSSTPTEGDYIGAPIPGGPGVAPKLYRSDAGSGTVTLNAASATVSGGMAGGTVTVQATGAGAPAVAPVSVSGTVPTMPPFLGSNFIICVDGIYPSRP